MPVRIHRLRHQCHPLAGHIDRQEYWEGSFNSCSSHNSYVCKPRVVGETKMAVYTIEKAPTPRTTLVSIRWSLGTS